MTRIRAAGDAALLIDTESEADGIAPAQLAAAIGAVRLPGVIDIIPGDRTVLVVTEPGSWRLSELTVRLSEVPELRETTEVGLKSPEPHEIPVRYDGPDLAAVAELTGLTVSEVIDVHAGAAYTVGWLGFSPGFGYLRGLDPALHVPRLAVPRIQVPEGSVAIAGPVTAVYPSASPGGWRLLGRTSVRLWDPDRDPPAVLAPGMRVRFRPVRELPSTPAPLAPEKPKELAGPERLKGQKGPGATVEVIRTGPLATVQDLGRPGYGHLGVPRSGAADAGSLRLANRLVGNPEGAAGIELTMGGARLLFHTGAWAAVTGAPAVVGMRLQSEGDRSGMDAPFHIPAGSVLTISAPAAGLRSYLAVRGGFDVRPVLGSRSADMLSGLGPAPLRTGDVLKLDSTEALDDLVADFAPPPATATGQARLRVIPGPRDDWFTPEALRILLGTAYQVSTTSNRAGLRLSGPALPRIRADELPSEGLATGALQVPPDGQPILHLADHPVTGGYPVIAVVVSADIALAAQVRPGEYLTFAPASAPR
jgi:KipI family sensor histidine kinase inhibitor